jgi:hypothetical protein
MNRNRLRALNALDRCARKYPHLRIGQIIVNALPDNFHDPYYAEDGMLASALESYLHQEATE